MPTLLSQMDNPDPLKWPLIGLCVLMITAGLASRGRTWGDFETYMRSPYKARAFGLFLIVIGVWAGYLVVKLSLDQVHRLGPHAQVKLGLMFLITCLTGAGLGILIQGPIAPQGQRREFSVLKKVGLCVVVITGVVAELGFWFLLANVRR